MIMASATQPTQGHPDRISEEHTVTLGINAAMTFLATLTVSLRFISRRITVRHFWWDDWAILASLSVSLIFLSLDVVIATVGGAGYHIQTYSRDQLSTYLQISLANTVLYNASITLSKLSVLFLYHRIFSIENWLYKWILVMGGLLAGYFLAAAFGLIFSTSPVEAQWKFWLPHTTIDRKPFWLTMGVANLLFDIIILCIPQSRVWKLQQSRKRRILISLVFLLGGFVCIASVVRIVYLLTINTSDLTYTFHTASIWTLIEMNISIVCACLPVLSGLYKLVKRSQDKTRDQVTNRNYYLRLISSRNKSKSSANTDKPPTPRSNTTTDDRIWDGEEVDLVPVKPIPAAYAQSGFVRSGV
ncbi:hypothetical protein F5X96DRAFT_256361 [Biscogniauxia mediterranea]|nr:hypothetical protein F5X96DRAFT_256361 [Biscogniauxia mediterranea]